MIRCKHCLAQLETTDGPCAVCGILPHTRKSDLFPGERLVRRRARIIRGVAMLHLIGAGLGLLILHHVPVPAVAMLVLATINLTLAIGLSRFAFWAYRMATVYYFLIGMVNVVSVNLPGILMILILLYCIGNGTAKALFERRTL